MVLATASERPRRPFFVLLLALDAASSLQFGGFRNALPVPSGGEHFDEALRSHERTIVLISQPRCRGCRTLRPKMKRAQRDFPDVGFLEVDLSALPSLEGSTSFTMEGAVATPTVQLYEGGRRVDQVRGQKLRDTLDAWLGREGLA